MYLLFVATFVSFSLGLIFFVNCSHIRSNYPVYFPLLHKKEVDSSNVSTRRNPLWFNEAFRASREELLDTAGADAVVYIALLEAALEIIGFTAIYSVPVLIGLTFYLKPPYFTGSYNLFDFFNLNSVPDGDPRIWAFVGSAYWLFIVTCGVLWRKYKKIANLRAKWLVEELRPHDHAVLLRKLPLPKDGKSYEDQVNQYFRQLYPSTYERSIVVYDVRRLEKIFTSLISAIHQLEDAKLQTSRRHKFLGIGFKGVKSIKHYQDAVEQLNKAYQVELEQARQTKQRPAAFAIFNNPIAAALAARATYSSCGNEWRAFPVSDFRGIIWENFYPFRTKLLRVVKRLCFTLLPAVPLSYALWFIQNKHTKRSDLVALDVPSLLAPLIFKVLLEIFLGPSLLHILELTNIASRTALQRYSVDILFTANIIFIIADVKSSTEGNLYTFVSFFLTFVSIGTFSYGYRLSRVVRLIRYRLLSRSKSAQDKAWAPTGFDYIDLVPRDLLVLVIALCYASIAPLVLPFALIFFALGRIITRHEALKVKLPSYESGGRMWPHMHKWILAALLVSQFLLVLHEFGHFGDASSLALAPLPFLTVAFGYVSHKRFSPVFGRPLFDEIKKQQSQPLQIDDIVQALDPASSMQKELSQALDCIKPAAQETEEDEIPYARVLKIS